MSVFKAFLMCSFFLSHSFEATVNFSQLVNKSKCKSEVRRFVGKHLQKQSWVPAQISQKNKHLMPAVAFRNTLDHSAHSLWNEGSKTHYVKQNIETKKQTTNSWSGHDNCKMTSVEGDYKTAELPKVEKAYTDADLKKTLTEHKWGVIYIWSPYMPLSVQAIKEIKTAVAGKGGHLTVLLEGKASLNEAKKWAEKEKLTTEELIQVGAAELYARDVTLHYPAALIYADGFLSNRTYVGHKSGKIYEKWIDTELAELKKDMMK